MTLVVAVLSVVVGGAEWATWRASRLALPHRDTDPSRTAAAESVLVLGCPSPIMRRWRVRIAIRSTDPSRARFVFSGGAVRTAVPEAQMMADYAVHDLRVPADHVVVEDRSSTTVENLVNSVPFMADSPSIKIASDTFHALRARLILREQYPELAERLVRARDYIPFEWGLLHAAVLAHNVYGYVRSRLAA